MRPTSSQSSHWEGRPSTHVVPKQSLGTRVHCPRPHFLVEGLAYTEGTMCGSDCSELSHCDLEKAEDVVFGEVADWLMLDESDDISTSQKCNLRAFLPSRQGIKYATVANKPANSTTNGSVLPEGLLYFIALQLLASCYTVIPASNADSLPICRQRRTKELVTSLRLHSRYRFSPASGHSARPPSEASSWPGLYAGPTLEDRLADTVSNQRLFSRGKGEHGHDVPVVELAESYISTCQFYLPASSKCCLAAGIPSNPELTVDTRLTSHPLNAPTCSIEDYTKQHNAR
ncbi:hypothetical protein CC78DRAFT_367905 [Lojkania enalia]|uniref:Uncharacterized protein n=1 Tax=Lojkania enalia TaxID=147567 RepID=A0A9P4KGT7_9PLEO|nr:hypothetical protein CC78DRAFT_367905 [Didymosphaeria enalia]